MDHPRIEEENIAELYAAGQLSSEEEARFEEHLIECRECRERVASAADLRGSFQAMAAEDRTRAALGIGLIAWLARHERAARLGLAALLLLALVLPAWLLVEQGRLRRELVQARAAAPQPVRPPPAAAEPPGLASERDRLEAERRRLEGQLQAELRK
ncbi:MAG TPA: zf-HC2 domain-containing protein, partial [Thermoanaerobaculia bacterium]|nr:zf-HC2 domain-containing protein [Thermoanaerobaculia bacterium]